MNEMPAAATASLGQEAAPGIQRLDVKPVNAKEERQSLYAAREPIYPKLVHGKFRRIKWIIMIVTLGIYYGLPWLRWDRGPTLPDQAVLLDFAHQRLYFFGLEIWAQEFYYITGILILSALGALSRHGARWARVVRLHLSADGLDRPDDHGGAPLAGRPQRAHEARQIALVHQQALARRRHPPELGSHRHSYRRRARLLFPRRADPLSEFWHFDAPAIAYIFLAIFAATTYTLGGLMREQLCTYMCPWPRIQGAMFDADSFLITYRGYRGEPRGPHKKNESWEGRGDCIDCRQCVAVCPTGIDIRDGAQLECIQCALCIDACDEIMEEGRPAPKADRLRYISQSRGGETR